MKKIEKLLVSLLAIALVISASCVVAFAADDSPAITDSEIEGLVKIYGDDIFCAEDFESASSIRSDSDIVDESGIIRELVSDGENTVAKLVGAASGNKDVVIAANPGEDIAGIVFEMDVAASGGVFNIYVGGQSVSGDKLSNTLLVSFDFSAENGSILVQKFGLYELPVIEALEGVSLVKNAWYSVCVIYDASTSYYTISLVQTTDEAGVALAEPISYSVELPGVLSTVSEAKVAVSGVTMAEQTAYVDDLYLYAGNAVIDFAAKEAMLGAAVVRLVEKLDAAAANQKAAIVEKLETIVIDREFASVEYADDIKYAKLKLAEYFTEEYKKIVNSYNGGDLYEERVARIAEIELAYDFIPEIPEYTEEENAAAYALALAVSDTKLSAFSTYNMIIADFNYTTSESIEFIKYLADKQLRTNRYDLLKEWIDTASKYEIDPTFKAVVVEDGVSVAYDIAKSYENYLHLIHKLETLSDSCETFIECVDIIKDLERSFSERYAAYALAMTVRFLDVEHTYYYDVENEDGSITRVYPLRDVVVENEQTGELEVISKGALSLFDEFSVGIQEIEKVCVNFIAAISDAKSATNISGLDLGLSKAEKYDMEGNDPTKIALEFGYPGVTEAVADYKALCEKRVVEAEAAEKFVAAVELVRAAKDKSALQAAMSEAAKLLPKNILDGYDGYSDAIAYYSDIEATLLYNETNASNFIALVNSLATATTYVEKYNIMKAAKAYLPELDMEIEGVALAKAVLSANIQAYNVEMQKTNDAFDEVVGETAKMASATVPTDAYLRVVAIIKKIFE